MSRTVIFANGHLPRLEAARALLRPQDTLIAADGGARHLLALGLLPHLLVGDLDSLDAASLSHLEAAGVDIYRYPTDKDETDLELALRHALEREPESILIVGALGGRLDQTLANLSLLTAPQFAGLDLRLDDGAEEAFFCREQAKVQGRSGEVVSLLPWGGAVEGVITQGLRWKLSGETLYPHQSRGISNRMLGEAASVEIRGGLLLVVHERKT
ncbi:MAG: thiamine diphosphokinase [Anaerolineales bacterium]